MPDKPKILTLSLAGCCGCHMSLQDIDWPTMDDGEQLTIGLVEGGCCNEGDVRMLRDFRRQCRILVAVGDCAIMGGIPAMRNGIPLKECLDEAYLNGPSVHNPSGLAPNDPALPQMLDRVYPCSEVVKIDHSVPGCPPSMGSTASTAATVAAHGKVTILLDEAGQVRQARLHVGEFRGFERFVQGRLYWEIPVLVQRLCGICSVSHHLAAAKAMDVIVGVDQLTPTAEKMRRLMHYGHIFQSHARHVLQEQGGMMRRFGRAIVKATAGREIHGTGAIPGGINKNLTIAERDELLKDIDQMLAWSRGALKTARDCTVESPGLPSNHLSLAREDGAMDLYNGGLRAIDAAGNTIFDHGESRDYLDYIAEDVRSWSYMKFPFIKSLGVADGWYRVGPLARVNTADFIDTPEAEAARQEFRAVANISRGSHWARMIELLHACEKIRDLLNDADLQGYNLVVKGERRSEGVGIVESPGGTLFHHYRVDENDQVTMANVIGATTSNNEPMNRAIAEAARKCLSGQEITADLLNHIELAIRAYDPCLACARPAVGQMPLEVTLVAADGAVLDRKRKSLTADL